MITHAKSSICHIQVYEPRHEISNNVVCATSKASDQSVHTLLEHSMSVMCYARLSLHLSKCHIVGDYMWRFICRYLLVKKPCVLTEIVERTPDSRV